MESYFDNKEFKSLSELQEGEYENCIFRNCNFIKNNFSSYIFTECEFQGCDLSLCTFNNTSFNQVNFVDCKILGVSFEYCNTFGLDISFENCNVNQSSFFKLQLKIKFFYKYAISRG